MEKLSSNTNLFRTEKLARNIYYVIQNLRINLSFTILFFQFHHTLLRQKEEHKYNKRQY
jgi:hypothetical protein